MKGLSFRTLSYAEVVCTVQDLIKREGKPLFEPHVQFEFDPSPPEGNRKQRRAARGGKK